jgi:YebC/PmpR family DNA-binding regulatory protein
MLSLLAPIFLHRLGASRAVTPSAVAVRRFAGHSKWAKIARGKGEADKARSLNFNKLSRGINAAAKAGGPDPSSNMRLAGLLEAARKASCPKDIIERALRAKDGLAMTEVTYEVTAAGGAALLVDCLTDNVRRTAPAIRYIATQNGAEVAAPGAAAWQFAMRGRLSLALAEARGSSARASEEAAVFEEALAAGAIDVDFPAAVDDDGDNNEGVIWVEKDDLSKVRAALAGGARSRIVTASLVRVPTSLVSLEGADAENFGNLLAELHEHEDVQAVCHNAADE